MFDFVSLTDYTPVFNYGVLLLLILALVQCFAGMVLQRDTARLNALWGCSEIWMMIGAAVYITDYKKRLKILGIFY